MNEISDILARLASDDATRRALSIASCYLQRAGQMSLAQDMRIAATDRADYVAADRMRLVAAIVHSADDATRIDPSLLVDVLTRSPRKIASRLSTDE